MPNPLSSLDDIAVTSRPLRKDAARNRERIVEAATACLADHGDGAQMEDVARRAKVGVGTVYRHFPTKDELFLAVAGFRFARFADVAREAIERYEPAEAFERYVWDLAELQDADRALCFAGSEMPGAMIARHPEVLADLRETVGVLVRNAQEAGTLREDFRPDDMGLVNCAIGHAIRLAAGAPELKDWRRLVGYILDGLRP